MSSAGERHQPWLPFEELVEAHHGWRRDLTAEPEYRRRLEDFEHEFGRIVDSYWCESVPSAVALSRRRRGPFVRHAFHRVSDWATKDEPEVAALLHTCDELTVKVGRILRGPMREIAMRLVVGSATHILSLVDEPAEHTHASKKKSALDFERKQLAAARRYYEEVGLRQAQLVYLFAMLVAGIGVGLVARLVAPLDLDHLSTFAAVLGAAGAVLSVIDRMSGRRRKFELDYELGTFPLVVLGALRPLLGAGFGLVVYAFVSSGIVNLQLQDTTNTQYLYALLAFVAGWSERLAKDVLDVAESTVGAAVRKGAPEGEAETVPETAPT